MNRLLSAGAVVLGLAALPAAAAEADKPAAASGQAKTAERVKAPDVSLAVATTMVAVSDQATAEAMIKVQAQILNQAVAYCAGLAQEGWLCAAAPSIEFDPAVKTQSGAVQIVGRARYVIVMKP